MRQDRILNTQRVVEPATWALAIGAALVLSACGGGGGDASSSTTSIDTALDTVALTLEASALPADAAAQFATPAFHVAPVILEAPDDADASDNTASARGNAHVQSVPPGLEGLSTRGLTLQAIDAQSRARALSVPASGRATPAASTAAVTTYTPAQIRAAYGFPALPGAGIPPTATQAAQQGAGQTIYLIDAMNDPNVAAELAAFNQKFGLPGCTTQAIAATSPLPLAAAPTAAGCTLSVVHSTAAGAMTAAAPAYDSGWATEIALDVQWAHATAPLARIVLIESGDASLSGLLGAVKLANAMGAGTVSMSFGSAEGNYTASVDASFAASGMRYAAATGDSGSGVSWPAVSANVVAVGGTSLTWSGTGARSESAWSLGGGGVSAYVATPAYQSINVPGMGTRGHRAVADVSFNANPSTGQYVAVIPSGSTTASWLSAGGTSLSTPQWAGLMAVANALRAQAGQAALVGPQNALYGQVAVTPGTYAADFYDVLTGADGSCGACVAKSGYDTSTGLGTPNATALLSALTGSSAAPVAAVAPVVGAASVSGTAGAALSYTVSVSGSAVSGYSVAGAPAGMAISSTGVITWANPVAGTYAVTVTAVNSANLSGRAVVTFTIAKAVAPAAPVITAAALSGTAGKALSGTIAFAPGTGTSLSITIGGVPTGMAFAGSGMNLLLSWPGPVAGSYALTITATNSAGVVTRATVPVTISAK